MRQQCRFGCSGVGKLIAQNLGRATVQGLATALEQILIGGVLDKRVLETIIGLGWDALHQQDVGLGQLVQCCAQRRFIQARDRVQ
jgi:hypothetical protein